MDLLIRINLANILIQKRLQIHQYDMSQCAAAKRKKYYCLEGFNKVFRFSILIVIIWTFRLIKTRLIILHCHLQTSIRLQHVEFFWISDTKAFTSMKNKLLHTHFEVPRSKHRGLRHVHAILLFQNHPKKNFDEYANSSPALRSMHVDC